MALADRDMDRGGTRTVPCRNCTLLRSFPAYGLMDGNAASSTGVEEARLRDHFLDLLRFHG
jgi:hypothetical protein